MGRACNERVLSRPSTSSRPGESLARQGERNHLEVVSSKKTVALLDTIYHPPRLIRVLAALFSLEDAAVLFLLCARVHSNSSLTWRRRLRYMPVLLEVRAYKDSLRVCHTHTFLVDA